MYIMYVHTYIIRRETRGARGEISFALLQKLEESALIYVKFLI